jgi:NAD(P)-dependent dehydrogenase (short-subunit alcohol dehydrogenase family)
MFADRAHIRNANIGRDMASAIEGERGVMNGSLEGRTVLLTGASSGIGAATARALGAAGAHLVAHYGSDEAGARTATEQIPDGRKLLVRADLAEPDAAIELWHAALGWRGAVDVLVNNAAVMEQTPLDGPDEQWGRGWERALQVNVRAPADLTREAVRHFAVRGGGVLIALSSWAAQRAPSNPALVAYAASKAAVRALTQTVARHHGTDGVLAYVISPGVVRTRLSEQAAAATGGEAAVSATLALGEWAPPEEVADLIAFLATGRCRHLTGATLDVNGATYIR